jgi:hypothetical protein
LKTRPQHLVGICNARVLGFHPARSLWLAAPGIANRIWHAGDGTKRIGNRFFRRVVICMTPDVRAFAPATETNCNRVNGPAFVRLPAR